MIFLNQRLKIKMRACTFLCSKSTKLSEDLIISKDENMVNSKVKLPCLTRTHTGAFPARR